MRDMMLRENQIRKLWEINMFILNQRSPGLILRYLPLHLALIIMILVVKQISLVLSTIILFGYIGATFCLFLVLKKIKEERYRKPFSYNLSSLLYQIYAYMFVVVLIVFALSLGDSALFWSNAFDILAMKRVRLVLAVSGVIAVACVFIISPTLTDQKIKRLSRKSPLSNRDITIILLANSSPGFFTFIAIMLSRTNFFSNIFFVTGMFLVVMGVFFIAISSNLLFEIIVLLMNKWPVIRRDGNRFIVE